MCFVDPLTLVMCCLLTPAGFGITAIVTPTSGIRAKGFEFETHLARVEGGRLLCSPLMAVLIQRSRMFCGSPLTLAMCLFTNICGFWCNGNRDSNNLVAKSSCMP